MGDISDLFGLLHDVNDVLDLLQNFPKSHSPDDYKRQEKENRLLKVEIDRLNDKIKDLLDKLFETGSKNIDFSEYRKKVPIHQQRESGDVTLINQFPQQNSQSPQFPQQNSQSPQYHPDYRNDRALEKILDAVEEENKNQKRLIKKLQELLLTFEAGYTSEKDDEEMRDLVIELLNENNKVKVELSKQQKEMYKNPYPHTHPNNDPTKKRFPHTKHPSLGSSSSFNSHHHYYIPSSSHASSQPYTVHFEKHYPPDYPDKLKEFMKEINRLRKELSDKTEAVQKLKIQIIRNKRDPSQMTQFNDLQKLTERIEDLKNDNKTLEKENKSLKNEKSNLEKANYQLKEDKENIINKLKQIER